MGLSVVVRASGACGPHGLNEAVEATHLFVSSTAVQALDENDEQACTHFMGTAAAMTRHEDPAHDRADRRARRSR